MPQENFFPVPEPITPKIYAYELINVPDHEGFIKIGYTERDPITRIKEQTRTAGVNFKFLFEESAIRSDGTSFSDKDVHKILRQRNFQQLHDKHNEWFKCTADQAREAVVAVRQRNFKLKGRTRDFPMRPEQSEAVEKTAEFFSMPEDKSGTKKFLWNAKMRFGKTFAAYQLCRRMGYKKILVLTFKPAAEDAWEEDISTHVDFEGWQFISNNTAEREHLTIDQKFQAINEDKPVTVFGSFQDLLGTTDNGGIKAKNKFIHETKWDIVIFDEYHFGAWREKAQNLFAPSNEEQSIDFDPENYKNDESLNALDETFLPIASRRYLYLSGTPFRALNSGEFIEDQIYSWTYGDEQREKNNWQGPEKNPYEILPQMVMMAYQAPESLRQIAAADDENEFNLNLFFAVKEVKDKAKGKEKEKEKGAAIKASRFKYQSEVKKWLELIRGENNFDSQRLPPMPYSDERLKGILRHTLWFLPDVASCWAMNNLLKEDSFFRDYEIIVCAGTEAGNGVEALGPVFKAMDNPLETRTITLSCGKLTAGVTVAPWSGVFMLRNLRSPETYFQAAFRAQSPWVIDKEDGTQKINKEKCYLFDFAIERALRAVADYSCRLDVKGGSTEKKVEEFIKFLPVLAYMDGEMKEINAQTILDFTATGTTATLLARRWQSAMLVNVDNGTLSKLSNDHALMKSLENIEAFKTLNKDIKNVLEGTKKAGKQRNKTEELSKKEKKKLTEEEKRLKKERQKIREKLLKFTTRVPIFMYLTDDREETLEDVIRQVEPELFKKVTGLTIEDFDRMCELNLFNSAAMNEAIYQFKRYEDASLSYTGIENQKGEKVGGFNEQKDRQEIFWDQPASLPPKEEPEEPPKPEEKEKEEEKQKEKEQEPKPEKFFDKLKKIFKKGKV